MWRHHFNKSEHNLLGVRFTRLGMHIYAPYKVITPNHWVFSNLKVDNQTIFGETEINLRPLSGDETYKIVSSNKKMTLLAQGLNCTNENKSYINNERNCGESSGADFRIIENERYNILLTGSIESGAGLGIDFVFTGII